MSTSVKHFHSDMPGAPTLNGVAGSLIAVLDACLVDGFGLKSVDSLVVSGGIATLTIASGHNFEPDVIALVSGATPAGLNGEKRVLSTSTTTVTFDATGITDQTASGAITIKLAPAGWAKPFSGTNIAAYRSNDVTGTRMFLRVGDTETTNARVVGYESMSDVNTGVRAFPLESQLAGGGWWPKASSAGSAKRAWTVVADSRCFWIHLHTAATNLGASGSIWGFGDFASYKSGDPYSCTLWANDLDEAIQSTPSGYTPEYLTYNGMTLSGGQMGVFLARSFSGLGGAVVGKHFQEAHVSGNGVSGSGQSYATPTYPNGPNNGLILTRKQVVEPGAALRGVCRGLLISAQNCHAAFNWRDKIDGQGALTGRKLMAIKCGSPSATYSQGVVFFDITGPWE